MTMNRNPAARLPDDPGYWERLAARSIAAAFRQSAEAAGLPQAEPWWRALADRSFLLAASAVLALIGGWLLMPPQPAGPSAERHTIESTLAPDDPLLVGLLDTTDGPPPPSALLTLIALRKGSR